MAHASLPYRRALITGPEISVYFDQQYPTIWAEHTHPHGQIAFLFDPASCNISWRKKTGAPAITSKLGGRHICFISPGLLHACTWESTADLLVINIRMSLITRTIGRKWSGFCVEEFTRIAGRDSIIWMMSSLCRRLCNEHNVEDQRLVEHLGYALALRLLRVQFGNNNNERPKPVLSEEKLRVITDYIERHFGEPPTIDDLAQLAGVSALHFIRLFKNTVGMPPGHYQKICRMRKAEGMLLGGKYRIKEIADALGFSDMSYFDRCFRKFFDVPPSVYRQRLRPNLSKSLQG